MSVSCVMIAGQTNRRKLQTARIPRIASTKPRWARLKRNSQSSRKSTAIATSSTSPSAIPPRTTRIIHRSLLRADRCACNGAILLGMFTEP